MGQRSFQEMVEEQKRGMPPVVKGDLIGKTVMVTGANSGIGYEAAKHFAAMNPTRLIIVCRSIEKAQDSINKIEAETGYKNAEPMALELSSFRSISELQVNALGPALHAILLLPLISKTANRHSVVPRIVVVSSEMIFFANIESDAIDATNTLETLSSQEYCTQEIMKDRYTLSKILNIMLVHKLAALLPNTTVPVALNPGYCLSDLRRKASGEEAKRYKQMEDEFAYTSEEGSRQIVFAAIGGKDEELRGAFTSYSKVCEISDWMLSEEGKKAEDKTWTEMLELFRKLDDRVPQIIDEYLKI
ncbi:hypothetical protein J3R30DRAFT_3406515 [Lentinula aciculospora]|uniref:NAD(P)-binding protein n=1 Tax=Lentinula aciculospora TaxID=153920 RepID=A0A9W9DJJ5_9AGAR|nr:hypothetical protein J3R30DRAFT_3406515 [Lentinula aciculospora]